MGWLITVGILVLLAILPLGVSICYNASGVRLRVLAGPVKITLLPKTHKQKKEKKPKEDSRKPEQQAQALPQPPAPPAQQKPKEEKGGSLLDFLPLVKLALHFLDDFRRKLRVNDLQVKLILAGSDPCDLAVNYGRAWTAVGNLIPQLEKWLVIKKRDIQVECDFTGSQTLVIAHVELTVTLGRLLSLTAVYAVRALKEYLIIKKKRKGGAVT